MVDAVLLRPAGDSPARPNEANEEPVEHFKWDMIPLPLPE